LELKEAQRVKHIPLLTKLVRAIIQASDKQPDPSRLLSKIGLNTFISGLRLSDKFSQINLQSVSSKGKKNPAIKFSLSAKIGKK
jgi:hypothetical protein